MSSCPGVQRPESSGDHRVGVVGSSDPAVVSGSGLAGVEEVRWTDDARIQEPIREFNRINVTQTCQVR